MVPLGEWKENPRLQSKTPVLSLHHDGGTKLQRHIGTKKEKANGTKEQRDKVEWFFCFVTLCLSRFVPQSRYLIDRIKN